MGRKKEKEALFEVIDNLSDNSNNSDNSEGINNNINKDSIINQLQNQIQLQQDEINNNKQQISLMNQNVQQLSGQINQLVAILQEQAMRSPIVSPNNLPNNIDGNSGVNWAALLQPLIPLLIEKFQAPSLPQVSQSNSQLVISEVVKIFGMGRDAANESMSQAINLAKLIKTGG